MILHRSFKVQPDVFVFDKLGAEWLRLPTLNVARRGASLVLSSWIFIRYWWQS